MRQDLNATLEYLRRATNAEDVFGPLTGLADADLKDRYRRLVRQVHPDYHPNAADAAAEAFHLVQRWYVGAQRRLSGTQPPVIEIASARHRYSGHQPALTGDLCDLYPAQDETGRDVLIKVVRNPANADLLQAEVKHLKHLGRASAAQPLRAHLPTLIESIAIEDSTGVARSANVLKHEAETVRLADVIAAYPHGIAAADMAWMFNRLLAVLSVTHAEGIVHGAVTPAHLLLHLPDHNGVLVDWCYSVPTAETIAAISPGYRAVYPPEVFEKRPATPATDLFMAAQSMVLLLGGDVTSGALPPSVPKPIHALLRACLIPSPHRRMRNAWAVFDDFRE
ncbi:MAG: hypothetical protein KDD84_07575, partial [Caldilineaceae bacterium]|nr:hypothetical protein [Caldilineaceae bacterium]